MTDHKFTDERIIRCLNECNGKENAVAYIVDQGEEELVTLARILEIINRQKAEIAEYQKHVDQDIIYSKAIKSEAIKEFADRIKAKSYLPHPSASVRAVFTDDIDLIAKEMTEGKP